MKPNLRLEEALKTTPAELVEHYKSILDSTLPEVEEELPPFQTLNGLNEEVKDAPLVNINKTGWSELDLKTAGGIAEGESVLLAAQAGAGKTHFAVNLAINYASKGKTVFYLTMEDGWKLILNRFNEMDTAGVSHGRVFMIKEDELTLENAPSIIKKATEDADLIIIDNLFALPLRQGNKGDYWSSQAEWVDDICNIIRSSNSSVLILHHLNKSQNNGAERYQIAGSTRLVNRVSQVWLLSRTDDEPNKLAIKIEKNRRSKFKGELWLESDQKGILRSLDFKKIDPLLKAEAHKMFNIDR